ncbi:hypothetical protein Acr_06g0005020 [Actinidia rufa]|uniref:Protein TIFY n=1 Tax=Actinidia rufa TaxID=165716 RepID=A0A7J0EQH1_9ERIC|nr:hypothetical protein Acr_06g0005020 [Actinidia rufa]
MSCTSTLANDSMKMENSTISSNAQTNAESLFGDHQKPHLESSSKDNMTDHQTLDLFRKDLLTKTTSYNIGKSNEEESQAVKRATTTRPMVPPKFYGGVRCASSLEQTILPGLSGHAIFPSPGPSGDKDSTSQLTIFYAGEVNVYDDVPLHKAQAIILLAGESISSAPVVANIPKTDEKKPLPPPNLPSICKLQAGLPIARRISLKRFLEKRHTRITNKCPYASSDAKHDENSEPNSTHHDLNEKAKSTPSNTTKGG